MTITTIAQAKANLKGSIEATVIQETQIKEGQTNGKSWKNKRYTLQDDTDTVQITLWGNDVDLLKMNYRYKLTGGWWKEFSGTVQLDAGKYLKIQQIGAPANEAVQNIPDIKNIFADYFEPKVKGIIEAQTENLYAIHYAVLDKLKQYEQAPDPQLVQLFTRIIYGNLEAARRK